ncbi:hypothetical protein AYX15_00478 [Cryptococcus neoformans]|nr:hypothetical protein AYX15_00478 [Cryptococcus neoformans var. grubii]
MAQRTTSLSGSSRLSLSVDKTPAATQISVAGRHPLRQDWSISYVHRPPNAKVDYEKEIRRVATFGSIESFLHLYSHLTPVNELPPVTDVLVFVSRIGRPGVWEEMRDGGRFTIRLVHPIVPVLYESLLFSLVGDQFDEADNVVGCVLSMRQAEGILSVWVEDEGENVRNGSLRAKILSLLNLPPSTTCDYRANRTLLENANKPAYTSTNSTSNVNGVSTNGETGGHGHGHGGRGDRGEREHEGGNPGSERRAHGAGRERGERIGGDREHEYHPRPHGGRYDHHHERPHRERVERADRLSVAAAGSTGGDRPERTDRERGEHAHSIVGGQGHERVGSSHWGTAGGFRDRESQSGQRRTVVTPGAAAAAGLPATPGAAAPGNGAGVW